MIRFTRALCRRPGPDFAAGLTTFDLSASGESAPDFATAGAQHDAYVAVLRAAGLVVDVLDDLPGFPDAHFVEDTAVVIGDHALVTRTGHESRRGEGAAVALLLGEHVRLHHARAPASGECRTAVPN